MLEMPKVEDIDDALAPLGKRGAELVGKVGTQVCIAIIKRLLIRTRAY